LWSGIALPSKDIVPYLSLVKTSKSKYLPKLPKCYVLSDEDGLSLFDLKS
jgi:hypothetical protein